MTSRLSLLTIFSPANPSEPELRTINLWNISERKGADVVAALLSGETVHTL